MSQLSITSQPQRADLHFALIADRLDAIGQRYRTLRLLRGVAIFVAASLLVIVITAILANVVGQGIICQLLLVGCCVVLLSSAVQWIIRPLLLRPTPVQMARMVESRVAGLHNGLTNSVLLAERPELRDSPFLPGIFNEVVQASENLPLNDAVSPSQLKPLFWKLGIIAAVASVVCIAGSSAIGRGLQQMLRPTQFIPTTSSAKLVDVKPGNVTLINGQPLELSIIAEDRGTNGARLIFDDAAAPVPLSAATTIASSTANDATATTQSFWYRQEHVDHSRRYRVEVGGTQSPWYAITVVKQVQLEQLALTVTPPRYTAKIYPPATITLKPDTIDKTPIAFPTGSHVAVNAAIDVPCTGAMMELADETPIPLAGTRAGRTFAGEFKVEHDAPLAILLTEKTNQIIARLPEQTLMVHATPDGPPVIEMKWPAQDTTVAPDAVLKITANLKDDYGLTAARISMATTADGELRSISDQTFQDAPTQRSYRV